MGRPCSCIKAITAVAAEQMCVFAVIDSFNSLPSCELAGSVTEFWKLDMGLL
jgi:hypothetical protein